MNLLISIVIYDKKIEELPIFLSFKREGAFDIFIYDNSKTPQEVPTFESINIYYEHDEKNSGVSRAYNRAYKKAKELQKELLLVLDQDTLFKLENVEKYTNSYLAYGKNYIYAPLIIGQNETIAISPFFLKYNVGKGIPKKLLNTGNFLLNDKSLINSGLMIPLNIFEKIKGFNEKIKLDFSDIYFIEKYKKIKQEIVLVDVVLDHSLSGAEEKNYLKELNRYKYYCNGARELTLSIKSSTFLAVLRRMLRLLIKYKKIKFIVIFVLYYLGRKTA